VGAEFRTVNRASAVTVNSREFFEPSVDNMKTLELSAGNYVI
jgi:hypothetical protein